MNKVRIKILSHRSSSDDHPVTQHIISFEMSRANPDRYESLIEDSCMVLEEWVIGLLGRFHHLSGPKVFDDGVDRLSAIAKSYLRAYLYHDPVPDVDYKPDGKYPELAIIADHETTYPQANVFCLQIIVFEDETGVITNNTRVQSIFLNRFTTATTVEMSLVVNQVRQKS